MIKLILNLAHLPPRRAMKMAAVCTRCWKKHSRETKTLGTSYSEATIKGCCKKNPVHPKCAYRKSDHYWSIDYGPQYWIWSTILKRLTILSMECFPIRADFQQIICLQYSLWSTILNMVHIWSTYSTMLTLLSY